MTTEEGMHRYRVESICLQDEDNERLPVLKGAVSKVEPEDGDEREYLGSSEDDLLLSAIVPKHSSRLLHTLDIYRRQRCLCDCTIYCAQREIHAHKCILGALSSVLCDAFAQGDSVEYNDYDFDAITALVDYAYTSELSIRAGQVAQLYRTAVMLHVDDVSKICAEHLSSHLTPRSCIGVRRAANRHSDMLLTHNVDLFIREHMREVMECSNEMRSLPWIQVRVIGATGEADDVLPHKVLLALQLGDRNLETLADRTHMFYLDEEDLQLHDCAELDEKSSVGSSDMVKDYKRMSFVQPTSTHHHHTSTESISNASGGSLHDDEIDWRVIAWERDLAYITCVAVFARQLGILSIQLVDHKPMPNSAFVTRQTLVLECNGEENKVPLASMHQSRCSHGVAMIDAQTVLVCGGYERGTCLSSCETFTDNIWTYTSPMSCERGRCDATSCMVGGERRVYVVGGSDGNTDLHTLEYYEHSSKSWTTVPSPMSFGRSHHMVVCVHDRLYVMGGMSGAYIIASCLRFDPPTGQWASMADMPTEQSQSAVVVYGDSIIVAGGCDRWAATNKVYKYSTTSDRWTQLPSLAKARRGCTAALVDGHLLHVIGGSDGQSTVASTEVMDLGSEAWIAQSATLNVARANGAAFLLEERVYVCGGFNGREFVDSVEVLHNDKWQSWTSIE